MPDNSDQIQQNYQQVLENIALAAHKAGRTPESVRLVSVTKGQPFDALAALYAAGARLFGESRVAEAHEKMEKFTDLPDIQWHMIGHIQSRKAGEVVKAFELVHAVDSIKLARKLNDAVDGETSKLSVLLQFNVSGEESKFGWDAADRANWSALLPEIESVLALPKISVRGLMTMAPYSQNPENARPVFVQLRELRDWLKTQFPLQNWQELSMGMSADYQVAIEEGATLVRVGTVLFHSPTN